MAEKLKEKVEDEKTVSKKKYDKTVEELEKAKADLEHWKNEYYRAYADMTNLRKDLEKDHLSAMKYRAEGFIEALLPILDSFHMALESEVKDEAVKNYLIGFQYIYKNMISALENEGVTEISPNLGDTFNADTMNAVDSVESDEENKIVKIYAKGYKLHDRLIRPANVQVSVKKKENIEA